MGDDRRDRLHVPKVAHERHGRIKDGRAHKMVADTGAPAVKDPTYLRRHIVRNTVHGSDTSRWVVHKGLARGQGKSARGVLQI